MRMTVPANERSNSAGNYSAAAGSRTTFAQAVVDQKMRVSESNPPPATPTDQHTRPSYANGHAHSAGSANELNNRSGQIEEDMAALEIAEVQPSAGPRDRRASWHVESPSIEGPRGAGVSYFALGLPAGR